MPVFTVNVLSYPWKENVHFCPHDRRGGLPFWEGLRSVGRPHLRVDQPGEVIQTHQAQRGGGRVSRAAGELVVIFSRLYFECIIWRTRRKFFQLWIERNLLKSMRSLKHVQPFASIVFDRKTTVQQDYTMNNVAVQHSSRACDVFCTTSFRTWVCVCWMKYIDMCKILKNIISFLEEKEC